MSSIFQVLFPEIWAKIHLELVTPLDARDRVSLQRTCKAAHSLDPGLILAPRWRELWDRVEKEQEATLRGRLTRDLKRRALDMRECRQVIILECVAQLDRERVLDWCLSEPKSIAFLKDSIFLHVVWTLAPRREDPEAPPVYGSLSYDETARVLKWIFNVFVGEDDGSVALIDFQGYGRTLKELLGVHPFFEF